VSAQNALEPGTRLVDRYRLEESLGQAGNTTYWRATDELLDRPVGVCLLQGDEDSAQRVLSAARRAAAVTDPRFLRVLDANETDGVVYVVSEWVAASNLAELIADRPLTAGHARELALEVAGALDAAHQQGLAHLCLTPEHVLRTSHGQVKVAGLAVDAAVHGLTPADGADASVRDTRGVAAILYAALTARWPGEQPTQVAPAPYDNDRLCTPRQVRAGVPDDLDSLVAHTLSTGDRPGPHDHPQARTPAELADRLHATAATSRIPLIRPASEPHGDTPPPFPSGPYIPRYDDDGAGRGRLAGRAAYVLAGLVLLVGLGLAAWQLASADLGGRGDGASASESAAPPTTATGKPLDIAGASTLDPPPGDGEENSDRAARTIDGDTATVWTTKSYLQQFGPGGLKEGVGLVLDLGDRQRVSSVVVTVAGGATDFDVRVSDSQGSSLADFAKVGAASGADGRTTVTLDKPVEARYVLVWLTRLPQDGSDFRGQISEVRVRD
jgi:F5/8 type C domain-containing protein